MSAKELEYLRRAVAAAFRSDDRSGSKCVALLQKALYRAMLTRALPARDVHATVERTVVDTVASTLRGRNQVFFMRGMSLLDRALSHPLVSGMADTIMRGAADTWNEVNPAAPSTP